MMKIVSVFYVVILLLIPALLNIPLKNYFHPQEEYAQQDLIYRMFGSLRGLLADWAFIKGEEYYHSGLPIRGLRTAGCLQIEMSKSREGHPEEREHEHETEEQVKSDFYSNLYSQIKITQHTHLSYAEEKEVLPWFYLQARFNPHDIQGYVLGGYWLRRLGKPEEALRFLKEGEACNPASAQILTEIGALYYKQKGYNQAIEYFERARQLWLTGKPPNLVTNDYASSDRIYTFHLLGYLYEKTGKPLLAAQVYTELYSFEPMRTFLLDKIKKLGTGSN
ncbi:hypothetical protein AUJ66_00150 [Candidatus Desantisbacteria bacterium CG1_02_38_46]|uniref:Tetratricopeptide repeat protein n=3 Tax=unclassified Candidatus Desantisiibacteriota TaxID=3106372 RepID=A0A2H9PB06_9BACT|nr:MAG: hypothetical protein AUJ66_00150 [Candidatus Desantisbacteria bacterium CG1_02_38_46]PIU51902.1 MAG: hypothetical protein COS91_01955 [Candidatus Desantisbacteria bacterium CG07_land_8_20_14_0_80_39_15]PIZ15801.1 MAG: hypothetical protein COY51_04370 [Candidatus Desantisbacteria bacterium CG_4_10_14_0_8_um_filter_39_17]